MYKHKQYIKKLQQYLLEGLSCFVLTRRSAVYFNFLLYFSGSTNKLRASILFRGGAGISKVVRPLHIKDDARRGGGEVYNR